MDAGDRVLPFVRRFYGQPSLNVWEDEVGEVQDVPQGEGGDQGDPFMPLLFSLAVRPSLVSTGDPLRDGEKTVCLLGRRVSRLQAREGVPSHRERSMDPFQDQRAWRQDATLEPWSCPGLEPTSSRLARRSSFASREQGVVVFGISGGPRRLHQGEVDEQGGRNTRRSLNAYLWCVTCSLLGSSCSSALPPRPTTGCEQFDPI